MKIANLIKHSITSTLLLSVSLNVFANPTMEEFLAEINSPKKEEKIDYKNDEYINSSLSKYLTREQFKNFKKDLVTKDRETEMMEGKLITFNTQDTAGCNAARIEMNLGKEVCEYNPSTPLVSVVVMRPATDREYFEKKVDFSKLSEKEKIGLTSLLDFGIMGVGAMGLIYSLPESVSKWDKSKGFGALAGQWSDRVNAGPVIDHDDWAVNYIGHPISGAAYYTMVRHQGFSAMQSAAFSFCMSTFFWEYGLEAFAEVPSIQDLILTPLIGSIIGEVFYSWGNAIERNDGKLLGSKALGSTATVLMNPAGALAKQINKAAKYKLISSAELNIVNRAPVVAIPGAGNFAAANNGGANSTYIGLQLKFKF